MRGDDMARQITEAALKQVPQLDPSEIDDLILGVGQPGGEQGNGLARVLAVLLGLDSVPGVTVQRYCSSSLQTTRMAMHAIRAGEGHAFLSVGVESVSRYANGKADGPPETHNGLFSAAEQRQACAAWSDPRTTGELPNVYISMGETAENVASYYGITRAEQDEFALRSQQLAAKAIANGFWAADITPLTLPDGTVVDADDCPRPNTTAEGLAALKPVFREDGSVTAGNACPLNDGAAALVIMSDTRAKELGITPLARVVSTGVSAVSPEIMGVGPIEAVKRALSHAQMSIGDIDLFEINEAFAAQVIPSVREIGVDESIVNVNGGAIAVGHPFGMTGARITTTLIHALQDGDKTIGLETMCVAGGQGMAMVIERLS
jgi:acetyl-CoA C-acetyltransferase